jgi:hypothetical protein
MQVCFCLTNLHRLCIVIVTKEVWWKALYCTSDTLSSTTFKAIQLPKRGTSRKEIRNHSAVF